MDDDYQCDRPHQRNCFYSCFLLVLSQLFVESLTIVSLIMKYDDTTSDIVDQLCKGLIFISGNVSSR